jgi:hypothetical protein
LKVLQASAAQACALSSAVFVVLRAIRCTRCTSAEAETLWFCKISGKNMRSTLFPGGTRCDLVRNATFVSGNGQKLGKCIALFSSLSGIQITEKDFKITKSGIQYDSAN